MNIPAWLKKRVDQPVEPSWCSKARDLSWQAFLEQGLPNKQQEKWKYTDLSILEHCDFAPVQSTDDKKLNLMLDAYRLQETSILLVFFNGQYMPSFTESNALPEGVIISNLQTALLQHENLLQKYLFLEMNANYSAFADLNSAAFADGVFVYIPNDVELPLPIHLLSLVNHDREFITHPRHVLIFGERSKAILLEQYVALSDTAYMMNVVTNIIVSNQAKLDHYKIQTENQQAIHMAHAFIQQAKNSEVNFTDFAYGGLFARDDIVINMNESHAECRTAGFYHLKDDHQYIDHHINVLHSAPHTHSEMLYKGILDKKSRAVFNGLLHVSETAQKITAYQVNHNLLLSNHAEVYSKPELVIFADDVKCKHGATVGQLDQDALFYLRSRGIEQSAAMRMLQQAFAEEVMQRVNHTNIKTHVRAVYEQHCT